MLRERKRSGRGATSRAGLSAAELLGLAHSVAGEVVGALAKLEQANLLGIWPGARPPRPLRGPFVPSVTPETHRHEDALELAHILSGRCAFSLDRVHYVMRAGDLFFVRPYVPHCETHTTPPVPFQMGWWGLRAASVYFSITNFVPTRGYSSHAGFHVPLVGRDVRDAAALLRRFAEADEAPAVLAVKEAMLILAVFVLRYLTARVPVEDAAAHDQIVRNAKAYIAANLGRPLSLAEIGRAVLLSPKYLTTLFRRATGTPLGAYIGRERIARAKELLATTRMLVKDVGYAVGFQDPYTFSRAFRRAEGTSPEQYRAKL